MGNKQPNQMEFDTSKLESVLSETTKKVRRNLLIASSVAFILMNNGIEPKSPFFTFITPQDKSLVAISIIILISYLLITFFVGVSLDFKIWNERSSSVTLKDIQKKIQLISEEVESIKTDSVDNVSKAVSSVEQYYGFIEKSRLDEVPGQLETATELVEQAKQLSTELLETIQKNEEAPDARRVRDALKVAASISSVFGKFQKEVESIKMSKLGPLPDTKPVTESFSQVVDAANNAKNLIVENTDQYIAEISSKHNKYRTFQSWSFRIWDKWLPILFSVASVIYCGCYLYAHYNFVGIKIFCAAIP